ncbi:MAG: transcriptional regulator, partial [Pseudomonas sp.]
SLHRMLSPTGNPNMDNLAAIFNALRNSLGLQIEVRAVPVAG